MKKIFAGLAVAVLAVQPMTALADSTANRGADPDNNLASCMGILNGSRGWIERNDHGKDGVGPYGPLIDEQGPDHRDAWIAFRDAFCPEYNPLGGGKRLPW